MVKELVTTSGEKHGLINRVSNSVRAEDGFKNMDAKTKAKAEKLKEEDHKIVKARYRNNRGDHERLTKPYCRWAGDPIETWHFIPGEVYELPYGLVREVNESPGLAKRSEVLDANGIPTKKDGKNERIHEFVAVGF